MTSADSVIIKQTKIYINSKYLKYLIISTTKKHFLHFTGDCPYAECSESVPRERANQVFQIRLLNHCAGPFFAPKNKQIKQKENKNIQIQIQANQLFQIRLLGNFATFSLKN